MSRVLIVARTRVGKSHCCIGALDLESNRSLRLLNSKGSYFLKTAGFQIGDIWEMDYVPQDSENIVPPHIEDVIIQRVHGRIREAHDLQELLLKHIDPWSGGPSSIFDGALRSTQAGSGYITRRHVIPKRSTGFWVSDRPLCYQVMNERDYYVYDCSDKTRRLKHVGYQETVDSIPPGTLLRVSLARWWQPEGNEDIEERCYLQLSGWY